MEVIEYPIVKTDDLKYHASHEGPVFMVDSLAELCYRQPSHTFDFCVFVTADNQAIYQFGVSLYPDFNFKRDPEAECSNIIDSLCPAYYMEKKTPMILSKNDVLRIEVALKKELLSIRWRLNEEHFCDRRVVQLGKMLEVPRFYIAASGDTIRITTPEDYLLQRINPNLSLITSYCNVCFVKGRKMVHPECGHLVCITCYFIYRKIRVSKNENAICSFCNLVWNEDKMSSVVYRETFCPIDRCRADAERDPTRYVMNPCGCVLLCMPENGEKPAVCPFEFCKENIAGDERKVFA